jgi:4-amino-4-deoxy-L-arabinose transferase-like glycosyltransferase
MLLFLWGNWAVVITDPVESNYTLTVKEMIMSGDYFSPRIYGHYWYDKPILFYWELAAAFQLFGISDFAARFFPALMGTLGVLLTYFFGKRLYDGKTGFVAAAILGTSLEYWYLSKAVITDSTLFVLVSAALVFFYLGYTEQRSRYYYIAYAAAGLAVLDKGPIGLCLPGLIILLFLALRRDFRALCHIRLFSGLLLCVGIAALWYVPMFKLHGWDFINQFFGVHNVLRATVAEHARDDVWYYYIIIFVAGFFPWVFSVPFAVKQAWKKRLHLQLSMKEQFLLVWAVTVVGVFQCFATKYLTYTFPYMMPVALLLALYLRQHERLVQRAALGMIAVYGILILAVAAPLCRDNSGAGIAKALEENAAAGDFVGSFGSRYSASLVYYSGFTVEYLVPGNNIAKSRPHKMDWTSNNVMPFWAIEKIPAEGKAFVVVADDSEKNFLQEAGGSWKRLQHSGSLVLYQRLAAE